MTDTRLQLEAVYEMVRRDDVLKEMSKTPLMLSIMALAYRGVPLAELLPRLEQETDRRRHLYNAYIRRVLKRRPLADESYDRRLALLWLRFLARQLTLREETQFFIEDLQPD